MVTNSAVTGIGIVGYGGFGEFIHKAWDQMDEAHVAAVCDSDASRNPGGIAFYKSVGDMLHDPNVHIVSVATPPSSHRELAIRAMQAGKHVLIEKPIALSVEDAEAVRRVSLETGRVATVNFVLRFNPLVEGLRKIVRAQVLGSLRRVDLRNYAMQETVPEGHWFWDPKVSGRILLEHGVHFFDLASWIVGAPAGEAWSLGVERKPGMEDRVFAAVEYRNGVVGTYWHSFSRPRELETTTFHFAFDLGEIEMLGWIPLELKIWGWTDQRGIDLLNSLGSRAMVQSSRICPRRAQSAERFYDVDHEVNASVKLTEPKLEVYAESLRLIMADLIRAIEDPTHRMRVTIEDAVEAVRVAELATRFAHPEG